MWLLINYLLEKSPLLFQRKILNICSFISYEASNSHNLLTLSVLLLTFEKEQENAMIETYFASPEKASDQAIISDKEKLSSIDMVASLLDANNTFFIILNENRQVVYANNVILDFLEMEMDQLLGQRPGEFLECMNALDAPSGCGTHRFCKECGALSAILAAQAGKVKQNECRIFSKNENRHFAWDLSVKASPFHFNGKSFVLYSITDISDAKRKEVLERTFFHDILNTAGGVYGFSEYLKEELEAIQSEYSEIATIIYDMSNRLVDEIKGQRMLLAAERNQIILDPEEIALPDHLDNVINSFKKFEDNENFRLQIGYCDSITLKTDKSLFNRILVNMIKNAVEACQDDGFVLVSAEDRGEQVLFSVFNNTYIEESIQHQIFQRSFSTKGKDRGIGTYSIKLFGEDYLKGEVWFESSKENGTTFYLKIPKWLEQ